MNSGAPWVMRPRLPQLLKWASSKTLCDGDLAKLTNLSQKEIAPFLPWCLAQKNGGWIGSRLSMTPSPNRNASKRGGKHGTRAGMVGCQRVGIAPNGVTPSCA